MKMIEDQVCASKLDGWMDGNESDVYVIKL